MGCEVMSIGWAGMRSYVDWLNGCRSAALWQRDEGDGQVQGQDLHESCDDDAAPADVAHWLLRAWQQSQPAFAPRKARRRQDDPAALVLRDALQACQPPCSPQYSHTAVAVQRLCSRFGVCSVSQSSKRPKNDDGLLSSDIAVTYGPMPHSGDLWTLSPEILKGRLSLAARNIFLHRLLFLVSDVLQTQLF